MVNETDGLVEMYASHVRSAESRFSVAYDVFESTPPSGLEDPNAFVRDEIRAGRFPSFRASLYFDPSIRVPSVWTTAVASDKWCV